MIPGFTTHPSKGVSIRVEGSVVDVLYLAEKKE
jgi:hypothetical protein